MQTCDQFWPYLGWGPLLVFYLGQNEFPRATVIKTRITQPPPTLPPCPQEHRHDFIENKESFYFNAPGKKKAHLTKELTNELFLPECQDTKSCTPFLEELAAVIAQTWSNKLTHRNKTNCPACQSIVNFLLGYLIDNVILYEGVRLDYGV